MRIDIKKGNEMLILSNAITGDDARDDLGKDGHDAGGIIGDLQTLNTNVINSQF
jgi:hypothetical protein